MPFVTAEPGNRRAGLRLAAIFSVLVAFSGVASHSLWTPDEPTGAAVGKNMLLSGDYILTTLSGVPFVEKPPLYWWAQALTFRLLGVGDAAARLPSAIFAALTLLVAYAIGRLLAGRRAGLLTVLVLATTVGIAEEISRVVVDSALAFFTACACLGWLSLVKATTRRGRWSAGLLIAVAAPLAFLSKGLIGLVFAAGLPMVFLLAQPRLRRWERLAPVAILGIPVFAAIVLPWAFALWSRDGGVSLRECLVSNSLGRAVGGKFARAYGHRHGPAYYLLLAPLVLLPWSLALPTILRPGGIRSGENRIPRQLLLTIVGLGVVTLSIASSKRTLYLVPLMAPLAAVVASWLCDLARQPMSAWDRRCLALLRGFPGAILLLLAVAYPALMVSPIRSPLALVLRRTASPWGGILLTLLALALGVAVLLRGRRHRQGVADRDLLWIFVPLLIVLLAWQSAIKAAVDPVKNLHQTTAAVARLIPGPGPIPFFARDGDQGESTLAILDFDLGRRVERLTDVDAVKAFFAARDGRPLLLSSASLAKLPPELTRRFVRLYDESGRTSSGSVIVALAEK